MFPIELPQRLIKMYSFYGETVLDPFLGSGTTCLAAEMEARNSIGYEINPNYEGLIRNKFDEHSAVCFGQLGISFENQKKYEDQSDIPG